MSVAVISVTVILVAVILFAVYAFLRKNKKKVKQKKKIIISKAPVVHTTRKKCGSPRRGK
jgi:preprotein translocase subunit YajC